SSWGGSRSRNRSIQRSSTTAAFSTASPLSSRSTRQSQPIATFSSLLSGASECRAATARHAWKLGLFEPCHDGLESRIRMQRREIVVVHDPFAMTTARGDGAVEEVEGALILAAERGRAGRGV